MYLLDTNVVSEMRKLGDGRADPAVTAWIASHPASAFFISALTVMEIEIGIMRLERRDPAQGTRLRTWLETLVLPEFTDRTLAIDAAIAHRCAALHVPDPRSDRDALIAATALHHGLTVVSRNTSDFAPTGVPFINPWTT